MSNTHYEPLDLKKKFNEVSLVINRIKVWLMTFISLSLSIIGLSAPHVLFLSNKLRETL